jgi:hypothetical protein
MQHRILRPLFYLNKRDDIINILDEVFLGKYTYINYKLQIVNNNGTYISHYIYF